MMNRDFATLASVPVVLFALLACKGFSKSAPKPTASVAATATAATPPVDSTPTTTPTVDVAPTLSAKPIATFGSPTTTTTTTVKSGVVASAKPSASASASAPKLALAGSAAPVVARDAGAAATAAVFKVGDKVQVFWKNTWYPAAVIAVPSPGQYKIHYDGYEASWDETVGSSRIKAR